ncbi:MAG: hypothetical protein RBR82_11810 [Pseudomonas sp.]|nr:hypothetical protein [Pseudomonas sp.]
MQPLPSDSSGKGRLVLTHDSEVTMGTIVLNDRGRYSVEHAQPAAQQ